MSALFAAEPARIIGLVASIVALVAQQVLASGIISSSGVINILNLVVSITPIIAAELTRQRVSPAK